MLLEEVAAELKKLGLKKEYRFSWESLEQGSIRFHTRRPGMIEVGKLQGTVITWSPGQTYLDIWSSRKQLVQFLAKLHGFPRKDYDGEAVLFAPLDRADEVLPKFSCFPVRKLSPAQAQALALARAKASAKGAS